MFPIWARYFAFGNIFDGSNIKSQIEGARTMRRTRRVLATRCASGLAIVAALFLCASTVDARALRSELDVGVTGVVTQNDLGVAKVLTDADDADSPTTNATGSPSPAAVETPTDAEDQPSPSSKNSDDDDVLSTGITKGLVRRTAVDGVVFVTWANNHYRDFARFWTSRLKSLGLTNFMVGAMDDELHEYMKSLGVATWPMGSVGIGKDAVKKDFGWGSQNFHKMGRDKIRLIRDFTKVEGISVLISDIDAAAMRALQQHPWPGNVRELRNAIERAMILGRGSQLSATDFAFSLESGGGASAQFTLPPEGLNMDALERDLVEQALQRSGGNQSAAAQLLGMTRDQIRYRIDKYRSNPGATS